LALLFLEHQQASDATVAIFKGADALKPDMEIQNLMEADIRLRLVFLEQLIDGCGDLCRRCSLTELGCGGSLAVSGGDGSVALMAAALTEQGGLQLLDERLCQRLHGVGENHIHAKEVVAGLDDIIDLDGLFVREDAVGLIQHLDLISGESVAGHAPIAVDHVDLQVLIEAAVHPAVALLDKCFEKFGKLRGFLFLSGGLGCILGYVPDAELLIGIRDASLGAISVNQTHAYIPFFCNFFYCDVVHFSRSFQLVIWWFLEKRGTLHFHGTFSTRVSTRNSAKSHVPVGTIWTVKCPFYAVLSNFLSHFHRVQDLGSDGIQEVSGSIPRD